MGRSFDALVSPYKGEDGELSGEGEQEVRRHRGRTQH